MQLRDQVLHHFGYFGFPKTIPERLLSKPYGAGFCPPTVWPTLFQNRSASCRKHKSTQQSLQKSCSTKGAPRHSSTLAAVALKERGDRWFGGAIVAGCHLYGRTLMPAIGENICKTQILNPNECSTNQPCSAWLMCESYHGTVKHFFSLPVCTPGLLAHHDPG